MFGGQVLKNLQGVTCAAGMRAVRYRRMATVQGKVAVDRFESGHAQVHAQYGGSTPARSIE